MESYNHTYMTSVEHVGKLNNKPRGVIFSLYGVSIHGNTFRIRSQDPEISGSNLEKGGLDKYAELSRATNGHVVPSPPFVFPVDSQGIICGAVCFYRLSRISSIARSMLQKSAPCSIASSRAMCV